LKTRKKFGARESPECSEKAVKKASEKGPKKTLKKGPSQENVSGKNSNGDRKKKFPPMA
jgi:hypothetical protein